MREVLEKLKPAASARTQLALAGCMWSVVGLALAGFGALWLIEGGTDWIWVMGAGAALAGAAKSRFVLDRTARRMAERIRARGDGRCVGGFLSPWSWLLVAVMASGGRLLRSVLPPAWAGALYLRVGTGLLLSSRLLWAYRRGRKRNR